VIDPLSGIYVVNRLLLADLPAAAIIVCAANILYALIRVVAVFFHDAADSLILWHFWFFLFGDVLSLDDERTGLDRYDVKRMMRRYQITPFPHPVQRLAGTLEDGPLRGKRNGPNLFKSSGSNL
jgi:hypothetical protein